MIGPPTRATVLLIVAIATGGWFLVGTMLGTHPDGAIFGFSAAFWAAWDNEVMQQRRRRQVRRRRKPKDVPESAPEPQPEAESGDEPDPPDDEPDAAPVGDAETDEEW